MPVRSSSPTCNGHRRRNVSENRRRNVSENTTKVWLNYNQEQLNDQYEQRILVPDADQYLARQARKSENVRAMLDGHLNVSYGASEDETLDWFPAAGGNAPFVVYIHGGAWTRSGKEGNSYLAPAFVDAGVAFVPVNFGLVPSVNLDELVRRCRRAVEWAYIHALKFGADPNQLYVAGHSSGAHLAGMLSVTDWSGDWRLPSDVIKGVFAASGIYDLEPVRLSARNAYLNLDAAAVDRNSPMRLIRKKMPPMMIAFGECEQEEFRRQSITFTERLENDGDGCRAVDLPRLNHFDVGEEFANSDGVLLKAVFGAMGL